MIATAVSAVAQEPGRSFAADGLEFQVLGDLGSFDLDLPDVVADLLLHRPEHLLEQGVALLLVGDLRVLLSECAQIDAGLERVHREQVFLPLAVERIQQYFDSVATQ